MDMCNQLEPYSSSQAAYCYGTWGCISHLIYPHTIMAVSLGRLNFCVNTLLLHYACAIVSQRMSRLMADNMFIVFSLRRSVLSFKLILEL